MEGAVMGLYLILINLVTFILYAIDKIKAKMDSWRISERILLFFALIGVAAGALLAMIVCRHKIRKNKFRIGIPLILLFDIIVIWVMCT